MPHNPDPEKIATIRSLLAKHPQGLWVREIARRTGLDKSTVSIYLSKYMAHEVDEVFPTTGNLIKIVRLKR